VNRPLLFVAAVALSASGALAFAACTGNGSSGPGGEVKPEPSKDGGTEDSPVPDLDGSTGEDTGPSESTCVLTRSFVTACNKLAPDGGEELTCGDGKFDAWCELNDKAINSAAYRRAEQMCLTTKNCAPADRHDCEYRSYGSVTPTAAQKQVVAAYCQTCEPTDTNCAARKTTYDALKGPKSTDDVFIAAWELNDALDDEIRVKCTGSALDASAGPDAAVCLKAFGNCAGGIYVDHLPDCP
jgi:hypothetical protein